MPCCRLVSWWHTELCHMQSCSPLGLVVGSPLLNGLCSHRFDIQLGVVFWFVWVDCFLHRDGVFFLDAICFIALAGATFSFAEAGFSTIEALSLESFSFRLCRCCSCWLSWCTSWWVGGGDRVKWLNCRRRRGVLLVLVLAHQVRFDFLWGTSSLFAIVSSC